MCTFFSSYLWMQYHIQFSIHYIQVMLDTPAESNFLVWINCGSLFEGLAESLDISRYISHGGHEKLWDCVKKE